MYGVADINISIYLKFYIQIRITNLHYYFGILSLVVHLHSL